MTHDSYDKATAVLNEIEELKRRRQRVAEYRPTYFDEYPDETKSYLTSIDAKLTDKLNYLEKLFDTL